MNHLTEYIVSIFLVTTMQFTNDFKANTYVVLLKKKAVSIEINRERIIMFFHSND